MPYSKTVRDDYRSKSQATRGVICWIPYATSYMENTDFTQDQVRYDVAPGMLFFYKSENCAFTTSVRDFEQSHLPL